MEGTSTTVYHHKNNLSWALLLNSWSKDMDLDGLVKYALSTIKDLPFWQGPDVKCNMGEYFVMSADKKQCVQILLPYIRCLPHILEMQALGYKIEHLNTLTLPDDVKFNIIWKKSALTWTALMDVEENDFENTLFKMKEDWRVYALEVYQVQNKTLFMFVFQEKPKGYFEQKVYVVNDWTSHDVYLKSFQRIGYRLCTQSVLAQDDSHLVACIMEKVHNFYLWFINVLCI